MLISPGVVLIVFGFLVEIELVGPQQYCENFNKQLEEPIDSNLNINESNEIRGND